MPGSGRPRTALSLAAGLLCLLTAPASAQQRMTLMEELRIGALDGPAALSRVVSLVQGADGRSLYVADARDQAIRIFDAGTGALVRTIGRVGSGPGEFRRIGALTFRADTLYAGDTGQRRLVVFTRDGEHVDTRRIVSAPLAGTERPAVVRAPTPAGTYWAEPPLDAGLVAAGRVTELPSVVLSRAGEVLTTVATQTVAGFMDRADFGGRIAMFMQPMRSPFDRRAYASDGSALVLVTEGEAGAGGGRFRVVRVTFEGDTVFDRSFAYTPRPVPPEARDSLYAWYADGPFRGAPPGQALALAREHVVIPQAQPPVTGTVADPSGATWIRREGLGPTVRWQVLDATGSLAYVVEAPAGLRVMEVVGRTVWAVEKDGLGVPWVVKLGVRPAR